MLPEAALKLVMAGAATTVTVVELDLVPSAWEVAVMVKGPPAVPGAVQTPVEASMLPPLALQVMPVFTAPETVAVKVVLELTVLVGFAGLMVETLTALTVTVAVAVTLSPAVLVTVKVYVLVAVRTPVPYPVPETTAPIP
jgi:hypothetical protein